MLIQYDNLNSISFKQSLLADNVDHQIIANDPAATTPPRKKLKKRRPREATKKNNAIKGSKLPQNPLKSIENNREKSDLEMTLPITNSFVGNDSPLSTRIFKDLFSCASVGLGGLSPSKTNHNYSSPTINSRSSISTVSSYSFSPLALHFNQHASLILSRSPLISCFNPKGKQNSEDPFKIDDESSGLFDKTTDLNFSNLSNSSNQNFWNTVEPNFQFIMGQDLIKQCQEADLFLADNNLVKNSTSSSYNEFLEFYNKLLDLLNEYAENLQNGLLLSSNEIHNTWQIKRTELRDRVEMLQKRHPNLKEEVTAKLNQIDHKWSLLEKILIQRDSYNKIPNLKDLKDEISDMDTRIREAENKLIPYYNLRLVNSTDDLTIIEMYHELQTYYHLRLVPDNNKITNLVFRCLKYNEFLFEQPLNPLNPDSLEQDNLIKPHEFNSNSFYPSSSNRPNIQNGDTYDYDLLNAAKNLENRWNKIRLAFIEVFISIEGTYSQLNSTSTNSPTSFNTTWDKNKLTTDDENIIIPSLKTIKITRNFVSNHKTQPHSPPPPFLIHAKSAPSNLGGVLQNRIYNFRLYSSINSTNHQRQLSADIENPYLVLHDTPLTSEEDDDNEINEVEEDTIPFLPEEYEKIIDTAQPPNASMKNSGKVSNDEKEYRLTARITSPARKGVGSRTYGMKDTANIDLAASPSSDDSSRIVTTTSTTTVTKNIQISKMVSHIIPYEPEAPFHSKNRDNLIHDYWKKDRESFYTTFHDEGRTPFSRHKRWDIPAPPTPQNEKSFISNDDETSQGNPRVSCSTGNYLYDRRPPLNTTGYEKRYSCPRFKNGYYNSYSMDIKPLYHQHFPPRYARGHFPFSRVPPNDAYGKRIEYEDTTVIRENRVEEESRQMRMPTNVPKTEKGPPICRPICERSGNVTGRNRFFKSKFLSLSDDCLYASLPQKLTSHLLFHGYREPGAGTSHDKPLKYLDEASYPNSPIRSNTTDILLDAYKKRAIEREILAHHMGQRIKLPDSFGSANQSWLGESDDPYKSLSFGSSNNNDKWYDPALLTTINKHVSLADRSSIISNKIVSSCPKYISTPSNWVDSHNYLLSVSGDITSTPNPKIKVVTSTKKPVKGYNNNNLKTTSFDFSTTSGDEEPSPRRQLYNKKLNNRLKIKYLNSFKTKGAENNVKKHDLKVNREDFKAILSATTDDNNSTNEESMWDPYQAPLYATDEEADHILQSLLLQYKNDCPGGVRDVKFESAVEEQTSDKDSTTADDNTCSSKEGHDELGAGNVGMNSLSLRQFEDGKPLFYYGIDNSRGSHTILFDTPRDCITTRSIHNFCQKIKKNKSKRSSSNSDSACYVVFDSDSDIEDLKSILVVSKKDLSRAIDAFCKFRSSSLKPPPKSLTKVLSTRDSLINYIDAVGAGPFNQRMYDLSTLVNICRTHIYFLKTVIENIYPDILDENEDTFNARTNGISFDSSLDYIDNKEEDVHHHQSSNSGIRGLHIQDKNKIFLLHDKWQQLLYNLKTYVPEIKYLSFFKSYLIDPESSDSLEQFEQFSISHLQNGNKLAWLTQNAKGLKSQKKGFPFSADNTNSDFLDGINLGHPISTTNPENLTSESSTTHHRTLGKFNDPYDITEITSLLHSSNELIDNLSKKITNLRYRQSYSGKSKNMLLAKHPQAEFAPKTRSIISKINMFSTPIGNRRFWKYFTFIVLLMFLLATYLYLNMPSCCDNRNNFKRSLNFVLNYPYGPPPK